MTNKYTIYQLIFIVILNPLIGVAQSSNQYRKPKFKRCNIQLSHGIKDFGFSFDQTSKTKYMINTIEINSPAFRANLRKDDVIIQINGRNIRQLNPINVKEILNESLMKRHVEILAIDKWGYLYYKMKKKHFSSNKLVTSENTEDFFTDKVHLIINEDSNESG